MTMELERRFLPTEFEVRTDGDKLTLEGYALKWNSRSGNLGGFKERVAEGATDETIKSHDIRALFNHDPSLILGRNTADTLRLSNDSEGTHYEIQADLRQSYVRDLAIAMERGDVTQSSFGFRVAGPDGQTWDEDEDGFLLRTLTKINLFDVSPVTYPAYEDSTSGVGKRALADYGPNVEGMELVDGLYRAKAPEVEPVALPELVIPNDDLSIRARLLNL